MSFVALSTFSHFQRLLGDAPQGIIVGEVRDNYLLTDEQENFYRVVALNLIWRQLEKDHEKGQSANAIIEWVCLLSVSGYQLAHYTSGSKYCTKCADLATAM
jgi:hypothetical protein